MDNREQGLQEIISRITIDREGANTLGINRFKRVPTTSLQDTPILVMLEDEDNVIKQSKRGQNIYPCERELEVVIELIVNENETDIRTQIRVLRTVVFTGGVKLLDGVFIRELRTVGPFGYGVPDILGMRLILGMLYTDNGN